MLQYTYGQLRAKINLDLDLQNETNITADEMVNYFNEALNESAREILTLYEDYFLRSSTIALVSGTSTYSLPSDIFANKIRSLLYVNGSDVYQVRRIRGDKIFLDKAMTDAFGTSMDYRYMIQNTSTTAGYQLVLVPTSRITGSYLTIWYIRAPAMIPLVTAGSQAASDAIVIDLPEFYTFILQFVRVRCLQKDGTDGRLPEAISILQHEREMMTSTLSKMVPDDDDTIVPDLSHYSEHE